MDIGKILEALIPTTKTVIIISLTAVTLASVVLFFMPHDPEIRASLAPHRGILYLVFIGAIVLPLAIGLVNAIVKMTDYTRTWRTDNQLKRIREQRLQNLTTPQKQVLAVFLSRATTSLHLDHTDGVARALERAEIIYQATEVPKNNTGSPAYNLEDWAWKYLNAHPDLLAPAYFPSKPTDSLPAEEYAKA
jgi:hypothetical protein